MLQNVDHDNLANFIDSADMAVLDFWAPWCAPCKMMAPIFEDLSDELKDKIVFGKVNVDNNEDIAKKYKVMGMPTIVLFKHGKAVEKVTGVYSKEQLKHYFDRKMQEI
ncbi:thioredoxin [Apilactobacillus xinyiensis]|uniref:thioredoxin n=1 Tax=Apilactobacillus xinyiensis TaxID=2841032 RepID=UPI001C7D978C|nr:thioredoxin [Apilactobacillus xinyiensis]MCL0319021.1 thioredoxin [Apilactobacillus xinyiensis]MCL0330255.1 thioredoxin [Apilactobacillus xinyiensis]